MTKKYKVIINKNWCKSCRLCVKICPVENLKITKQGIKILNKCTGCKLCEKYCPDFAIEIKNETD
jgi:NAD-dependent dihydropyrimidine dehydrogenase PreA subunit